MRDTTPHMPPATPDEAEELAVRAVKTYLNACRMTDRDQISNYLMKLCSVAGVMISFISLAVSIPQRAAIHSSVP